MPIKPLFSILGLCCLVLVSNAGGTRADIRASAAAGCDYELSGILGDGDADRLKKLAEPHFGDTTTFCLNSPGGSFSEALTIAQFMMHDQPYIRTVVGPDQSCYSACALVFMAGAYRVTSHRLPDRWLHVRGKLGFHAPYIDPAYIGNRQLSPSDLAVAFSAAMQSSQRLLALLGQQTGNRTATNPEAWVHPGLIQRFLKHGPQDFYYVDTIAKAAAFNVSIFGTQLPDSYSSAGLSNACDNFHLRLQDRFLEDAEKQDETVAPIVSKVDIVRSTLRGKPGFSVRFGFGGDRPHCAVSFADQIERGLFESMTATWAEDGGKTGVEFFPIFQWPSRTRLRDLPVAARAATPTDEEAGDDAGSFRSGPYRADARLAAAFADIGSLRSSTKSATARGPSFDCGANKGAVERVICGNATLSGLDVTLDHTWRGAISRTIGSGRELLLSEQRLWVRDRAKCGGDIECLKGMYEARISLLRKYADP